MISWPRKFLNLLLRIALRIASTKLGGLFFTTVQPHLDRALLKASGGRYSIAGMAIPTLLLTTKGRKTGKERTAPLLYLPSEDAETFYVIGSRGGRQAHAGWYYNILSDDEVSVTLSGQRSRYRAIVLEEPTRSQIWRHFLEFNRHFNRYEQRVTREIPVIQLKPLS
ncbi:MAG: nitroreductase family deazaflavin-dependent oxidoreductase [Pseudomonadales bacterium]|nr:nitroreductase family deazaflavin-dependent oxidoreductase [Pseudomonadales bacterium]